MKRLSAALALSALLGVTAQAQTILTASSWVGPTHTLSLAQKEWCETVEKPFLGNSAETLSVAYNRIASKHPEFNAEHQGVKVLSYFTHGPGIIFNTKQPIAKVEDLTTLKFRVGGGMVNEISKSLGMNVTLKPAPDSYELLSGGVMDGTLFPAESTRSSATPPPSPAACTTPASCS